MPTIVGRFDISEQGNSSQNEARVFISGTLRLSRLGSHEFLFGLWIVGGCHPVNRRRVSCPVSAPSVTSAVILYRAMLMEAMAQGKIVVAPAITGIPELVIPGRTGFLYEPGSMNDFVGCVLLIR